MPKRGTNATFPRSKAVVKVGLALPVFGFRSDSSAGVQAVFPLISPPTSIPNDAVDFEVVSVPEPKAFLIFLLPLPFSSVVAARERVVIDISRAGASRHFLCLPCSDGFSKEFLSASFAVEGPVFVPKAGFLPSGVD